MGEVQVVTGDITQEEFVCSMVLPEQEYAGVQATVSVAGQLVVPEVEVIGV